VRVRCRGVQARAQRARNRATAQPRNRATAQPRERSAKRSASPASSPRADLHLCLFCCAPFARCASSRPPRQSRQALPSCSSKCAVDAAARAWQELAPGERHEPPELRVALCVERRGRDRRARLARYIDACSMAR
jgi:hypothetical protein